MSTRTTEDDEPPPAGTFARRVWDFRSGRSRNAFAHTLGIDPQSVYRWEREGRIPRGPNLERLAQAMGTTAQMLLGGAEGAPAVQDEGELLPSEYKPWLSDAAKRYHLDGEQAERLRAYVTATHRIVGIVEEDDVFRKARQIASGSGGALRGRV